MISFLKILKFIFEVLYYLPSYSKYIVNINIDILDDNIFEFTFMKNNDDNLNLTLQYLENNFIIIDDAEKLYDF